MLEREEFERLMSFVGERSTHEGPGGPLSDRDVDETVSDLASILSLPEFLEENNADLPFCVTAWYRGNTWGDAIQTIRMEGLRYDRESAFLADWMTRLTRKAGIHCFDRTISTEFVYPDEGLLQIRIVRERERNALFFGYAGPNRNSETIEVWEKGAPIRRTNGRIESERIPILVQDGTAVVVHRASSNSGVEVLVAEGEFGRNEWKSLLACMCLQGSFKRALKILEDPAGEESAAVSFLPRLRAFLSGVAVVTKSDGYVLRPLPAIRATDTEVQVIVSSGEAATPKCLEAWHSGWNHLTRRDFVSTSKAFSSSHRMGEKEWNLPLEERLANHLESLAFASIPLKEEIELTVQFWEGIFQELP